MHFTQAFIFSASFVSYATAHMLMANPVPYGKSSLNNSPLDGSGSDFPCKQRAGVYVAEGASNVYAIGSTQTLKFTGQAVHGGGSCQISITKDLQPGKSSVWKVIHSIEGGCPAQGQAGNMGSDASAADPYTYDFVIPKVGTGNYTLAMTWFNKIGNREMYMNCAPLQITGSGGDDATFSSLPDMFTANIGNGCSTPDSTDLLFPNPGAAVVKLNGATNAFANPVGTCQTAGAAPAPAGVAPTTTAAADPPASTATSLPGGVFVTVGSGATTAASNSGPTSAAAPPAATTSAAKPTQSSTTTTTSSSAGAMSGACTNEGDWNCIGGTSFQRCASGMWSAVMAMAAGTSCKPGISSQLSMKRAVDFKA